MVLAIRYIYVTYTNHIFINAPLQALTIGEPASTNLVGWVLSQESLAVATAPVESAALYTFTRNAF